MRLLYKLFFHPRMKADINHSAAHLFDECDHISNCWNMPRVLRTLIYTSCIYIYDKVTNDPHQTQTTALLLPRRDLTLPHPLLHLQHTAAARLALALPAMSCHMRGASAPRASCSCTTLRCRRSRRRAGACGRWTTCSSCKKTLRQKRTRKVKSAVQTHSSKARQT